MPRQKDYSYYDDRLVALLDRAVENPVSIRRKFRTYSGVYGFRHILYYLRFAARAAGVKQEWDNLSFRITRQLDLEISNKNDRDGGLEDILSDVETDC